MPSGDFAKTELKIEGFKAGYGTVLYFNDDSITKTMQESNPLYADNFPVWAEQASFGIPKSWRLVAQMPFGVPTAQPVPKEFMDITTRVKRLI